MKSNPQFMSSTGIQAVVTLFVILSGVLLFVFLLERYLPTYSYGPIPVLIAVLVGGLLSPPFDAYLKRRFPKTETSKLAVAPKRVSGFFVISLIGLHVIAIGLIFLIYKSFSS